MGRPKVHDQRRATVLRIDPEVHDRLKAEADQREVSVNYLVCKAIEAWLAANTF